MKISLSGILGRLGKAEGESIGIAFSGGGARGFSHIGVIMAFERFGISPDIMSGVSAGSIASVLYGAGLTPQDMIQCFTDASRLANFTTLSVPKAGFMKLDRFGKLLSEWLPVSRLEELKIPVIVCATDFEHGRAIGWAKGEIVPRVLASCSIPVVFHPVSIDGIKYVDGGVLHNLPAWAIRNYCRFLYGSNCSPLRKWPHSPRTVFDMAYRTFHLMMKANTLRDIKLCDEVINVHAITGVNPFDLSSLKKGVLAGYESASRQLEKRLLND